MKNLYTKSEFLIEKNKIVNELQINEGFFGKLFGKFWNYLKGIKGGQEVKNIYDKYVKIINNEFQKKGKTIQLDLADGTSVENKPATKPAENKPVAPAENQQKQGNQQQGNQQQQKPNQQQGNQQQQKPNQQGNQQQGNQQKQNASYSFEGEMLNEAEQVAEQEQGTEQQKFDKAEHANLMKIVNLHKTQAQKEMNAILTKYGGAEKSPKLAATIGTFIYQFDVALTRAELKQFPNDNQLKNTLNQQEKEYNQKVTAVSKGTTQDAAVIDIGGKKLKLNTPYQYNVGGQSKTIMITGKSKDNDKVIAKYVSDVLGKTTEQPFRVNLIKTDFVPEMNKKYDYFSTKERGVIEVEVLEQPDKNGLVLVKTKNGQIRVKSGALMAKKAEKTAEQPVDKEKQGQAGNQSAQPAQKAAPATNQPAEGQAAPETQGK